MACYSNLNSVPIVQPRVSPETHYDSLARLRNLLPSTNNNFPTSYLMMRSVWWMVETIAYEFKESFTISLQRLYGIPIHIFDSKTEMYREYHYRISYGERPCLVYSENEDES